MIDTKDIIDIAHRVTKKKRKRIPDKTFMHPIRDWTIGVFLAALLFLALMSYIGLSFVTQLKSADEAVHVEIQRVQYQQDTAQSVLKMYDARTQMFSALRSDRSSAAPTPRTESDERADDVDEEGPVDDAQATTSSSSLAS